MKEKIGKFIEEHPSGIPLALGVTALLALAGMSINKRSERAETLNEDCRALVDTLSPEEQRALLDAQNQFMKLCQKVLES